MRYAPTRVIRISRDGKWLFGLALAVCSSQPASASATKPAADSAELEQAKALYEDGVKAMKSKKYRDALVAFKEAYRHAPDLHLFTFNIASAAEHLDDCHTARTYYGMFLDLVPDHPNRRQVEKTFAALQARCPYDAESVELVTTDSREERAEARAEEKAARALNSAVFELRRAATLYEAVHEKFPEARQFASAAARKKRHAKRVLRLLDSHGYDVKETTIDAPEVPSSIAEACRRASGQEKRNADAFEVVLELHDSREIQRVMSRYIRKIEYRERPRFKSCAS